MQDYAAARERKADRGGTSFAFSVAAASRIILVHRNPLKHPYYKKLLNAMNASA